MTHFYQPGARFACIQLVLSLYSVCFFSVCSHLSHAQ